MESIAFIAGVLGTILVVVVPISMLLYLFYFRRAQRSDLSSGLANQLSTRMIASHFGGFALFLIANSIPVSMEVLRLLVAFLGIILLGVVPTFLGILLLKRQLLPRWLNPYIAVIASGTAMLGVLMSFGVWIATQAVHAIRNV